MIVCAESKNKEARILLYETILQKSSELSKLLERAWTEVCAPCNRKLSLMDVAGWPFVLRITTFGERSWATRVDLLMSPECVVLATGCTCRKLALVFS